MSVSLKIVSLSVVSSVLAGCVGTPEQYESTPVEVKTSQGVVTCQLYTKDVVLWDRAIDRPASMSVKDADAICVQAGEEWAKQT